jgi:starch phosphorylase
VDLAGLDGADVEVEAVVGTAGADGEIVNPQTIQLVRDEDGRWSARFTLTRPGTTGYTVRVIPQHPVLAARAELGMVTTA